MKITGFLSYPFWSYNKNADLPDEVVIRQIILYGEISDMILLAEKIDKLIIQKVLEQITPGYPGNKKRINFFKKVILDE